MKESGLRCKCARARISTRTDHVGQQHLARRSTQVEREQPVRGELNLGLGGQRDGAGQRGGAAEAQSERAHP